MKTVLFLLGVSLTGCLRQPNTDCNNYSNAKDPSVTKIKQLLESHHEQWQTDRADVASLCTQVDTLSETIQQLNQSVDANQLAITQIAKRSSASITTKPVQSKTKPDNVPDKPQTKPESTGWTGAIVYVELDGSCPACTRLVDDLRRLRFWTVGQSERNHFQLRPPTPAIKQAGTPVIQYVEDGKIVATLRGYTGNIRLVLEKHPLARWPDEKTRKQPDKQSLNARQGK